MAKFASKDVGFHVLGSYSLLGSDSKFEDTVELKLNETPALGEEDESFWSSGARKTTIEQEGWFDDGVGSSHEAFKELSDVSLPMSIAPHGNVAGTRMDCYESVDRVGYTVQLAVGDVHKAKGSYGCYFGKKPMTVVHELVAETTAGNTDADDVQCPAGGSNGGASVVHIVALDGSTPPTNCTITLRHSTDGTTYVDKHSHAAFTPTNVEDGIASEYKTFTGTINEYVSAAWAYSGGTSPTVTFVLGVYVAP